VGNQTTSPPFLSFYEFLLLRYTLPVLQHINCLLGTYFEHCPAYCKNGNTALSTVKVVPKNFKDFSEKGKIVWGYTPHSSKSSLFCELFHFKFCKLRSLVMFASCKGPKNHPVFEQIIF
jgi:hypothetical protein